MKVAILGAGAFGTAMAIALARRGEQVGLWARDSDQAKAMAKSRDNARHLPGAKLPAEVKVTSRLADVAAARVLLLALPMQEMAGFLAEHSSALDRRTLVSCAKGFDLATGRGATGMIARACPGSVAAALSGPGFAPDMARGLPTALTLACASETHGERLQADLTAPALRLYRTSDVVGTELGGALKNVIAIGAGVTMGAKLGESARAALVTRGFAEMRRLAPALGAEVETLMGLSGLGDLVLTATSPQSRNYRHGLALGAGKKPAKGVTVEGIATAEAAVALGRRYGVELPVTEMVAALTSGRIGVAGAVEALLARPLRRE